jgi:Zn-finger nucleic acid-binding protein
MKCPRCNTPDLLPTMIEEALPAMGCDNCHGSLVSLLHFRYWAETHKPTSQPSGTAAIPDATDTTTAIRCPKCERIMMKYKLTGNVSNRIDVCSSCDESWLDGGEWELLEALQLSTDIPAILTDSWQRRIRREITQDTRRGVMIRMIGEDGVRRVEEFKGWLDRTDHRSDIMTYLYRK